MADLMSMETYRQKQAELQEAAEAIKKDNRRKRVIRELQRMTAEELADMRDVANNMIPEKEAEEAGKEQAVEGKKK